MACYLSEMGKAHTDGAHLGETAIRSSFGDMLALRRLPDKTASGNVEAIWSSAQRSWVQIEAWASLAKGRLTALTG